MKRLISFLALAFVGLLPVAAHAAPVFPVSSVCPVPINGNSTTSASVTGDGSSGGESFDTGYLSNITAAANTSCNVLITFGANSAITTTNPNPTGFYDAGGDDNLVGIINNSGSALFSFNLSSSTQNIFGFDGDGICGASGQSYNFASGVGLAAGCSNQTYLPAGITLTNLGVGCGNVNRCGTVNIAGGIANGGGAYFSLEDSVDLNHLAVTPSTPEPSSLVLLGTGVLGLAGSMRRRFVK